MKKIYYIISGIILVCGATFLLLRLTVIRDQPLSRNQSLAQEENKSANSAIFDAIRANRLEELDLLLDQGTHLTAKLEDGSSALHVAALEGSLEAINRIVAKGGNISAKSDGGLTPLTCSVMQGHLEATKLLIDLGADVNPENVVFSPLIAACLYEHNQSFGANGGRSELIDLLYRSGVDLNEANSNDVSTVEFMAEYNAVGVIEHLLDLGATIRIKPRNEGSWNLIEWAYYYSEKVNDPRLKDLLLARLDEDTKQSVIKEMDSKEIGLPPNWSNSAPIDSL